MHLIQKKLIGQEVPSTLPPSLIPPALRSSFFSQSPFSPGVQTQTQPEPVVDLVSFEDPLPSAVQSPAQHSSILKPEPTVSRTPKLPIDHDPFSVAREFDKYEHPYNLFNILQRVAKTSSVTMIFIALPLPSMTNRLKLEMSGTSCNQPRNPCQPRNRNTKF